MTLRLSEEREHPVSWQQAEIPRSPDRLVDFLCHIYSRLTTEEQSRVLSAVGRQCDCLDGPENTESISLLLSCDSASAHAVSDAIFAEVRSYAPALVFAMNVLADGGTVGLLTARENREGNAEIIRLVGDFLSCDIPEAKAYFINDSALNRRLEYHDGDPSRKLQILLDNLNGVKFNAVGCWTPTSAGFDRIYLIDDERAVLKKVNEFFLELWVRRRLDAKDRLYTSDTISGVVGRMLQRANDKGVGEVSLWRIIRKKLHRDTGLDIGKKLRVFDAAKLNMEMEWQCLIRKLSGAQRPSRRSSLLLLDLDGTVLHLPRRIYVRSSRNPDRRPFLILSDEEFKEHPDNEYWILRASSRCYMNPEDLFVDHSEANDPEHLQGVIAKARRDNSILKPGNGRQQQGE